VTLVYTCGSMTMASGGKGGLWRKDLPTIDGIEWLHPRKAPDATEANRYNPGLYRPHDAFNILHRADMVLAVFEARAPDRQAGTCTEVGLAYAAGIAVVGVALDDEAREAFGFPLHFCDPVVGSVNEGVEYVMYANGLAGRDWL